jgi:hypothetical protein
MDLHRLAEQSKLQKNAFVVMGLFERDFCEIMILPTPVKIVYPESKHINISRGIDGPQKLIKWNPPFKVGGTNIFFVEMTFAATCAPQTLRGGFHFMKIWCFGSRASMENWDNYFHGIVARAGVPVWFDPHGHLYMPRRVSVTSA